MRDLATSVKVSKCEDLYADMTSQNHFKTSCCVLTSKRHLKCVCRLSTSLFTKQILVYIKIHIISHHTGISFITVDCISAGQELCDNPTLIDYPPSLILGRARSGRLLLISFCRIDSNIYIIVVQVV